MKLRYDPKEFHSPAFAAVVAADHPAPEAGGPCATCAFRSGTEANQTPHTVVLAALCVEGLTPFHCHEKPQLCRGWIAAANLTGAPETQAERRHVDTCRHAADLLADAITRAGRDGEGS